MHTTIPQNQITIPIPSTWAPPKYHLGQLVQQGWIIGIAYYPEFSALLKCRRDSGWWYTVVAYWQDTDTETISESAINPYPKKEEREEIEAEIQVLQKQLETMKAALNLGSI